MVNIESNSGRVLCVDVLSNRAERDTLDVKTMVVSTRTLLSCTIRDYHDN